MNGGHCRVYGPQMRITATFDNLRASCSSTALMNAVVPMLTQDTEDGDTLAEPSSSRMALSIPSETFGVVDALKCASPPRLGYDTLVTSISTPSVLVPLVYEEG